MTNTAKPASPSLPATARQRDYIAGLLSRRMCGAWFRMKTELMLSSESLSRLQASTIIELLLERPFLSHGKPVVSLVKPTPAVVAEAEAVLAGFAHLNPLAEQLALPFAGVSAQVTGVKPVRATEPGVYENAHGVFLVKLSKSSKLYAMRLDAHGNYVYAPGVIRHLLAAERVSFARACELSAARGSCIRCGRGLKVAESVAAGIGPVCAKKLGG